MIDNFSISVVVPVYNELATLDKSINFIGQFLSITFADYEVIIVESGSTDGSFEKCDEIATKNKRIKVFHEGARKGFGSALKIGFNKSTKDLVWLITTDLPFPLETIIDAVSYFDQYDAVLSYRSLDSRNFFKKLRSLVYNRLVKTTLGLKVRHVNSAFKVYKRELIQSLPLYSNGWFIDAEILYLLKEKKVKYVEIPVPLIDRQLGKTSVKLSTFISVLKELTDFLKRDCK